MKLLLILALISKQYTFYKWYINVYGGIGKALMTVFNKESWKPCGVEKPTEIN